MCSSRPVPEDVENGMDVQEDGIHELPPPLPHPQDQFGNEIDIRFPPNVLVNESSEPLDINYVKILFWK